MFRDKGVFWSRACPNPFPDVRLQNMRYSSSSDFYLIILLSYRNNIVRSAAVIFPLKITRDVNNVFIFFFTPPLPSTVCLRRAVVAHRSNAVCTATRLHVFFVSSFQSWLLLLTISDLFLTGCSGWWCKRQCSGFFFHSISYGLFCESTRRSYYYL